MWPQLLSFQNYRYFIHPTHFLMSQKLKTPTSKNQHSMIFWMQCFRKNCSVWCFVLVLQLIEVVISLLVVQSFSIGIESQTQIFMRFVFAFWTGNPFEGHNNHSYHKFILGLVVFFKRYTKVLADIIKLMTFGSWDMKRNVLALIINIQDISRFCLTASLLCRIRLKISQFMWQSFMRPI